MQYESWCFWCWYIDFVFLISFSYQWKQWFFLLLKLSTTGYDHLFNIILLVSFRVQKRPFFLGLTNVGENCKTIFCNWYLRVSSICDLTGWRCIVAFMFSIMVLFDTLHAVETTCSFRSRKSAPCFKNTSDSRHFSINYVFLASLSRRSPAASVFRTVNVDISI